MKKSGLVLLVLMFILLGNAQPSAGMSWEEYEKEIKVYAEGTLEEVLDAISGKMLFEGILTPNGDLMTPLTIAALYNPNPQVIDALVQAGFDVNQETSSGWSPLLKAIVYNNSRVVIRLQQLGALLSDINQESDWYTPLMMACLLENWEGAITLLELGAEINYVSQLDGRTALTWAVNFGNAEIIYRMVEAGADMNRSYWSGTELHNAIESGLESVLALIELGADVNAQDNRGYTPLMYITDETEQGEEIAEALKAAGGTVNIHFVVSAQVDEILTLFENEDYQTLQSDYIHPVARRNFWFNGREKGVHQALESYGRMISYWDIHGIAHKIWINREETEATVVVKHGGRETVLILWKHGDEWLLGNIGP